MRNRHVLAESAHGGHLVGMYGMNDAAGTQEEQCLEHGMCEKMEHAGHIAQSSVMRVGRGADT